MKIACLAWGSLVWDPLGLPIRRQWFTDGPFGRVELVRKSKDGRITFVLCHGVDPVRLLWAAMDLTNLDAAKQALQVREGLTATDWQKHIGSWHTGDAEADLIPGLPAWASANGIEAAVWTSLKPKFDTDRTPSEDEVVAHLRGLRGSTRDIAETYIRRAPRQVDTKYRRRIEAELGWTHLAGAEPT